MKPLILLLVTLSIWGCLEEDALNPSRSGASILGRRPKHNVVVLQDCDNMVARTHTNIVWADDSRPNVGPVVLYPKSLMPQADSSWLVCPVESLKVYADSVVYVSGINPVDGTQPATHIPSTTPVPWTYTFVQCCPDSNGVLRTVAKIDVP